MLHTGGCGTLVDAVKDVSDVIYSLKLWRIVVVAFGRCGGSIATRSRFRDSNEANRQAQEQQHCSRRQYDHHRDDIRSLS